VSPTPELPEQCRDCPNHKATVEMMAIVIRLQEDVESLRAWRQEKEKEMDERAALED